MKIIVRRTKTHGKSGSGRPKSKRAASRGRATIKKVLHDAFRAEFPTDTVDISDGYQGNIHVLVVSRKFDPMSEKRKINLMWRIIDRTDLTPDEKGLISLAYPISPSEIK